MKYKWNFLLELENIFFFLISITDKGVISDIVD